MIISYLPIPIPAVRARCPENILRLLETHMKYKKIIIINRTSEMGKMHLTLQIVAMIKTANS
jgi:hypothetical protein